VRLLKQSEAADMHSEPQGKPSRTTHVLRFIVGLMVVGVIVLALIYGPYFIGLALPFIPIEAGSHVSHLPNNAGEYWIEGFLYLLGLALLAAIMYPTWFIVRALIHGITNLGSNCLSLLTGKKD
jgi:hypothetical protein